MNVKQQIIDDERQTTKSPWATSVLQTDRELPARDFSHSISESLRGLDSNTKIVL